MAVPAAEVTPTTTLVEAARPADPAPLGLAAFALTTFILGLVNSNVVSGADVFVVLSVAGAYGGLTQLLAGMWAFAERNTFAAVAFSSYGAFWISFVLLIQFFLPETAKAGGPLAANHAVAVYLFCWGWFTFYMWIATFRINVALNLVFFTLWIAYLLLGIGALGSGSATITHWGGYVGIASAAASLLLLGSAPALLIEVFWLLSTAYLLAGRWPNGDPPAWRTGEAVPWPSSQAVRGRAAPTERRSRRARLGRGIGEWHHRSSVGPEDANARLSAAQLVDERRHVRESRPGGAKCDHGEALRDSRNWPMAEVRRRVAIGQ